MLAPAAEQLRVLVTGFETAIAGDVALLAAAAGASVVVTAEDADRLCRLDRRLNAGVVEIAQVALGHEAAAQAWAQSLRTRGREPHLLICCCGAPTGGDDSQAGPADVALTEHQPDGCPAAGVARALQPALVLHAEPLRRSRFDRALSVIRHPTLRGVIGRTPSPALLDPEAALPYLRTALVSGGPLRLIPLSENASCRSEAA
jgi:NAD(P)-dependent dehydrogenase (short-subunit alcohol dehydrogenase family)